MALQYFPSISSYSAVVLNAIFPEAAGREFLLHYHSEAMDQTLTNPHDVTWQEETANTSVMQTCTCKLCSSRAGGYHHIPAEW